MFRRFVISFIFLTSYVYGSAFEDSIKKEVGPDFQITNVRKIFYLASNLEETELQRCVGTISRMDDHLTKHFAKQRPQFLIKVYLFKDAASYEEFCVRHFGEEPSTPFGFYHSNKRMLVMNIATGRGTLAHEIVHPFIESDFPGAPAWFNEGFASLYEQSVERDGRMKGLINWRLPGLKKAIKNKNLSSLSEFMKDTSNNFYADESGKNYACARYLCFYLQEQGKLEEFYKLYRDKYATDLSGRKMLEQVFGKSLHEIEEAFFAWVMALKS
jgi:hypothetical protein